MHRKVSLFLVIFLVISFVSEAQSSFKEGTIDVGNIGINITNYGTIGRPNVRNDISGPPSMEYPLNSGIEHLFESGLWIGALVDGQYLVSTGAIDDPNGYSIGDRGFEFAAPVGSEIIQRSSLTNSDYFSLDAISHQDMILDFTDSFTLVPGTTIPIAGHSFPLNANVHLESYAFNYSFADYFVIFEYTITNNSAKIWDSLYFGMWVDLVIRNVNVATDFGAAFFNKGGYGFEDSFYANYAFDRSGDNCYSESYGAVQFLGMEWRDNFLHPSNQDSILAKGFPEFGVNSNWWIFNSAGTPPYDLPTDDVGRYDKMKNGLNFSDITVRETLQNGGSTGGPGSGWSMTGLLSVGPTVGVAPGETFKIAFAYVCAGQTVTDCNETDGTIRDSEMFQDELEEHLGWARRTYNGEDLNENGILDAGEDLNGNAILDRYILPEPPETPEVHIEVSDQKITLYWDRKAEFSIDPISKKLDFEGYRIYRTKVGEDLNLDVIGDADLIAQFDKIGNAVGYNNGFDVVRLSTPVYFDGDTTAYYYKYELDQVLNGWQYAIYITAFDEGDDVLDIPSLESSFTENLYRLFPGTDPVEDETKAIGVYPDPFTLSAAWDGTTERSKKIYFYNLPSKCTITIFTLSGEVVTTIEHDSDTYTGSDIDWFEQFGGTEDQRIFSGGEHAWDLLSATSQSITPGVYLFSVKSEETGVVKRGSFTIVY